MTCIVALEHDGKVYMGGDSLGSNGHTGQSYDSPKVFKKDGVMFGSCGSFNVLNVLRFKASIPKMLVGEDEDEYIYNRLKDAIVNCLKDNNCIELKDGLMRIVSHSEIIFSVNKKAYRMLSNTAIVRRKCGYETMGSGLDHADASLYSTSGLGLSPDDRIKKAIECSNNFVVSVNDDITIICSDDDAIK